MGKKLIVRVKRPKEDKLEFLAGYSEDQLETVGIMSYYKVGGISRLNYCPLTSKVNSFHVRNDSLENFVRKLESSTIVEMRVGDEIGWGRDYPVVAITCDLTVVDDKTN